MDIHHADGSTTRGFIDLYKRGHFVLEAKRVGEKPESSRWDKAMLRTVAQPGLFPFPAARPLSSSLTRQY